MTPDAPPQLGRVLIDSARIAQRVRQLGRNIAEDLGESSLGSSAEATDGVVFMPVMVGAFIFAADLVRAMPVMMSMRLVTVSSYPGTRIDSRGARLQGEIPTELAGRHVLVVDDILDSGRTLALLRKLILEQRPASLRVCVLLRKERPRDADVQPDFVGFDVPDTFVVGYGLDHDGRYRNLCDICALEPGS